MYNGLIIRTEAIMIHGTHRITMMRECICSKMCKHAQKVRAEESYFFGLIVTCTCYDVETLIIDEYDAEVAKNRECANYVPFEEEEEYTSKW